MNKKKLSKKISKKFNISQDRSYDIINYIYDNFADELIETKELHLTGIGKIKLSKPIQYDGFNHNGGKVLTRRGYFTMFKDIKEAIRNDANRGN